ATVSVRARRSPGRSSPMATFGSWNTVEANPRSRRHTHDRMAAVGGQGNARHGSGPTGKTPRRKGCATRPAESCTHYAPPDPVSRIKDIEITRAGPLPGRDPAQSADI